MTEPATGPHPLIQRLEGLHLFGFDAAPCSQRVAFALAEKGLARARRVRWQSEAPEALAAEDGRYLFREVSLVRGEHLTQDYARIHPHLVVPALVHDGRLVLESLDIIAYLDRSFGGTPLVPQAPATAARHAEWLARASALHVCVRYVSFHWSLGALGRISADKEALLEDVEQEDSPEQLAAFYGLYNRRAISNDTFVQHLRRLEAAFSDIERIVAGDGQGYLLGDFSVADMVWAVKVRRLIECGYPFDSHYPALAAWYARVAARPGFHSGIAGRQRFMHTAFRLKAALAKLAGGGIGAVARPADYNGGPAAEHA